MSFKNAQDLVPSNALDLSNTMRITKNDTDLRRSQPLLRKFADVFINLINTQQNTHSPELPILIKMSCSSKILVKGTYILSRNLEPARWRPLVRQCWSRNTFPVITNERKDWNIETDGLEDGKRETGKERRRWTHPLLCIRPIVDDYGEDSNLCFSNWQWPPLDTGNWRG